MNISSDSIEKQLEMLCVDFLKQLEDLKQKGIISQEEYIKHAKLKRKFLEDKNQI